jgi:hypothetical protein
MAAYITDCLLHYSIDLNLIRWFEDQTSLHSIEARQFFIRFSGTSGTPMNGRLRYNSPTSNP